MLRGVGARWGLSRPWRVAGLVIPAIVAALIFLANAMLRPSPGALAAIPSWLEVVGQVPADRDNAAVLYQRAFALTSVPDSHWDDVWGLLQNGAMPEGRIEAESDALVARHEGALALVHEAGRRPECAYPLVPRECVPSLPKHLSGQCRVVLLEIDSALALARAGDTASAFSALSDALACARNGFRGMPTTATFCAEAHAVELVCLAARMILREVPVEDAQAEPFARALRCIRPHSDLLQSLRADAAWGVASFDAALGRSPDGDAPLHVETVVDWPEAGAAIISYNRKVFIEEMAEAIDCALQPYRTIASAAELDHSRLPRRAYMAADRLPSRRVLLVTRDEALCWQRMCLIALQIEAVGEAPGTLEALWPALDQLSSTDVFSGEPFRYEKTGDGFRLYSIGSDLDDDGGRQQERQIGVARYDGDLVWNAG